MRRCLYRSTAASIVVAVACLVVIGFGCRSSNEPDPGTTMPRSDLPKVACALQLGDEGLPHRTELLVERERTSVPELISDLRRKLDAPRGDTVDAQLLSRGLALPRGRALRHAAFLVGRCRAAEAEVDSALEDRLDALIQAERTEPVVRIEAAMSLLLRGRRGSALKVLTGALEAGTDRYGYAHLAAFYLAQSGDPAGYPALEASSRADSGQLRLLASRHAIGFLPFDGKDVGGKTVDVAGLLEARLEDHDPMVRQEIPHLLAEVDPEDLVQTLERVRESDGDANVRAAAEMALGRLGNRGSTGDQ